MLNKEPKMITKIAVALCMLALSTAAFAEYTATQTITRFQFDPSGENYYFVGAAKWGAPSCPNATYVWFSPTLPNYKQMFAILYAAKMSGSSVQFSGYCSSDLDYFIPTYVFVY
jgi:hypothetical protein